MRTKAVLAILGLVLITALGIYMFECVSIAYHVKDTVYHNLGQVTYTYNDDPIINRDMGIQLDYTIRHERKRSGDNIAIFEMSFPHVIFYGSEATCSYTYSFFEYTISSEGRKLSYAAHDIEVNVSLEYRNGRWQFTRVSEEP